MRKNQARQSLPILQPLIHYLETQDEVDDDRLPEWDEFQELMADYEVRLS